MALQNPEAVSNNRESSEESLTTTTLNEWVKNRAKIIELKGLRRFGPH